jgi:hypothetical protein
MQIDLIVELFITIVELTLVLRQPDIKKIADFVKRKIKSLKEILNMITSTSIPY